jgi:hypothetical protein
MPQKEKAHLGGRPIPNVVLADNSEFSAELLRFQASLIVQRYGTLPDTASAVAILAFYSGVGA